MSLPLRKFPEKLLGSPTSPEVILPAPRIVNSSSLLNVSEDVAKTGGQSGDDATTSRAQSSGRVNIHDPLDSGISSSPRSRSPGVLASGSHLGSRQHSPRSSMRVRPNEKIFKFRKRKSMNPRLVLQNTGSVARDHLASERTFLAYVRTSLALASAGVALVQLFTIADLTSRNRDIQMSQTTRQVQKFAKPLGVTVVVLALVTLAIGMYRYFLIQHCLPNQKFPTARVSIAFMSFVLGSIIVVLFGALLSGRT